MPLTPVEQKYINHTLADMLERALLYRKLSTSKSRSARDRAMWKALYIEFSRAYNLMLKTLGTVSTSKLGKEQVLLVDDVLRGRGFDSMTDEEIAEIIEDTYTISAIERSLLKKELNKEFAQVFAVTQNSTPQVRKALTTLVKYKALDKFVDIDKLMAGQPPEVKALPRGNSAPSYQKDENNSMDIEEALAKVELESRTAPSKPIIGISMQESSLGESEAQKSKLLSILEEKE